MEIEYIYIPKFDTPKPTKFTKIGIFMRLATLHGTSTMSHVVYVGNCGLFLYVHRYMKALYKCIHTLYVVDIRVV
jgi:hypothetical protein